MNLFEKETKHKSLYGAYVVNDKLSVDTIGDNVYVILQDKLSKQTSCTNLTKIEASTLANKLLEWSGEE